MQGRSDLLQSQVAFGQGRCLQPALVSGQMEPKSRAGERREIFLPTHPMSFAAPGDLHKEPDLQRSPVVHHVPDHLCLLATKMGFAGR